MPVTPPTLNLDGSYYGDPAIYAAEREAIFRRSWQLLGAESALAASGSYLAADLAGSGIFVIRGADGTLRGFQNVCRHRGSWLLEPGTGQCATIRCPFHRWEYNDCGQLIDTPWFDEPTPFDLQQWPLAPIAVQAWRGLIFVAIAPDTSLSEQLGDLPGELQDTPLESFTLVAGETLSANLNWKTYLDQFVEYYHTPSVHVPDKRVGIENYTAIPLRGMMRMDSPPGASFFGGRWLWAWPNWTLSVFPGGMKTSRVNPVSAERIDVHFQYFFSDLGAASEATRARVINATSSIFAEDIRACERAQANYSSGDYRPGPLHERHERAVAYFQRRVREALANR